MSPVSSRLRMLRNLAVAGLAALLLALPAQARDPKPAAKPKKPLEHSIQEEKSKVEAGQARIRKLTEKERALHQELARVEDAVRDVQREILRKEKGLSEVAQRIKAAEAERAGLEARRLRTLRELSRLAQALWPLRAQALAGPAAPGAPADPDEGGWEAADRRFTWLGLVAENTRSKLALLTEQTERIREALSRESNLRSDAEVRLAAVNQSKDSLLQDKLAYAKGIEQARSERLSEEQALSRVLSAIEELNYKLRASQAHKFAETKGRLLLPAPGRVVAHSGAKEGGGRPGVGLSVPENSTVHNVFFGKVVHDDLLRGFGRVVIVYHGDEYYSLYAFLSETNVKVGQEIESGEVLGKAGFYPPAKGPGLYFELRFGQKPINPEPWFSARN